ncbi:MAG: TIGR02266 family protein [Myxococcota bacterium]|nr:TIGR02266 family protein [Myxococcota bacterium]
MSTEPKLIPLRIRLPYQTEEEFIEKYGSNVARGGVFIATRALKPEGSGLAFEFVLADGRRLIRGDGVVVKAQVDEGGTRAGMTVRFVRLDSASKAMIDRLIAARTGVAPQPPEHVIAAAAPAAVAAPLLPLKKVEVPAAPIAGSRPSETTRSSPGFGVGTQPPTDARAPVAGGYASAFDRAPYAEAKGSAATGRSSGGSAQGDRADALAPATRAIDARLDAPSPLEGHRSDTAPATAAPAEAASALEAPPAAARSEAPSSAQTPLTHVAVQFAPPAAETPIAVEERPVAEAAAQTSGPASEEAATAPAVPSADAAERLGPSSVSQAPASVRGPTSNQASSPQTPEALARGATGTRPRRRSSVLDEPIAQAPKQEIPEVVLGIDLGTTNARVAVYQGGAPRLIPLTPEGKTAVPSCVSIDDAGELIVGEAARSRMARSPQDAVIAAKRLIGQRARSKRVKEQAGQVPFQLVADAAGDTGVRLRDRVRSLTEISAALLSFLKSAAEAFVGHPVGRAVLCVPAYFTDHQRAAMREAGRLAGLEVVRIFNEPSAVALAFGHGKALPRKRILVYDLGGGTFDATVVEVTGDELEAVANGGDNFLGGMDFDARIASFVAQRFEADQKVPLNVSPISALRLRDAAERAKIALSASESSTLELAGAALRADGSTVDLKLELTRTELETLTADLVDRTLQVTRDVLASANLSPQSLDEVLLVGGQSRAPLVRKKVEELVARPVRTDVDAQAAVALGAAILGHAFLEAAKGKPGVALSEVLSAPIGIATRNGGMRRVLERNTRLPAEKTILLPARSGETIGVAVFQGAAERAEDNEYLGCLNATLDKNGEVAVRFSLASDGTLALTAAGPGGRGAQVTITTDDASDELRAALYASAPLPGEEAQARKGVLGGFKKLFGRS